MNLMNGVKKMILNPEEIELYNACKDMEKCLLYLQSHKHDAKALRYYYKYLKMAIDKLEKSGLLGDENEPLTLGDLERIELITWG